MRVINKYQNNITIVSILWHLFRGLYVANEFELKNQNMKK